jgi:hypothetical protein
MKDYFDSGQNMELGKVDYFKGSQLFESTPTVIYQIPLWNQQTYVQIWYSKDLHVDAQMSLSGGNRYFPATYTKGPLQRELLCTTLFN